MNGYTVVVGVDGSQPSRAAIRWAANRAVGWHCDLLLVRVLDDSPAIPMQTDEHERILRDARELLETERRGLAATHPALDIRTDLVQGDPVWALAYGYPSARAIVVGTHKTGFLRGSSFGSLPVQLAAVSIAPVIAVPSVGSVTESGVVVGVDDSADGEAALDAAIRFASAENQELVLVRCVSAPHGGSHRAPEPGQRAAEEIAASKTLAAARRKATALAPDLRLRSRIVHGMPAQALVRASAHASLLVVGRSRGTTWPPTMGRVSHDVLLNLVVATATVGARMAVGPTTHGIPGPSFATTG